MTANMKVFEGSTFAPRRITDVIVPAGREHLSGRGMDVLVLAASKEEALQLLAGAMGVSRSGVYSQNLRLMSKALPSHLLAALSEADLVDPSQPGCWFCCERVAGRPIAKVTPDSIEIVGTFHYDLMASKLSVVPAEAER